MKRWELAAVALTIVSGASIKPAIAQQLAPKMPRVGIISPAQSEDTPIFRAFREGLREHGYIEGQNIVLKFRLARGDYQ